VLELAVTIAAAGYKGLKFFFEVANLAMQGVYLLLSISPMSDLETVYFLCEHEHSVFSKAFG
jgi:hypothetical protein